MLALRSIARRVLQLTAEERELAREIETLTRHCSTAVTPQGASASEAAFARLAGAAPIPASSGQTIRYRLDRCGDRKLNRALHMILITRKRHTQRRSPTSNAACKKAKHDAKQTAASSATSPATSTGYSNTDRH